MHYYPSTLNEIAEAVITRKHDAARRGKTIQKLIFGSFQIEQILEASLSAKVASMVNPFVATFMDYPVEVVGQWAFEVIES